MKPWIYLVSSLFEVLTLVEKKYLRPNANGMYWQDMYHIFSYIFPSKVSLKPVTCYFIPVCYMMDFH